MRTACKPRRTRIRTKGVRARVPRGARAALVGARKKRCNGLQEGVRSLGMNPMPGTLDAHDARLREQLPDDRFVLGLDVGGAGARDEQCRSRIRDTLREVGKADDLREVVFKRFKVEAPMGVVVFADREVLQQERSEERREG